MAGAVAGPTLLVLAAGQGTRYGGLKQMAPVGPQGETMLDYAVFDAVRAGFARAVFVVGPAFADAFEARVTARYAGLIAVSCVCQRLEDLPGPLAVPAGRTRPWGTLHAVWSARAALASPFVVINADDFYGREAYERMAAFLTTPGDRAAPAPCAMVGYALQRTLSGSGGVNRGICTVRDGWLQAVVEHTDILAGPGGSGACSGRGPDGLRVALAGDAVASMNIWGFAPTVLGPMGTFLAAFLAQQGQDLSAECYLPAFVHHAVGAGHLRCRVLGSAGRWFGITYAEDRAGCVAAIQALVDIGEYPRMQRSGVE